ncbi:MAG: sulfotransferase, partial [Planctomycetota bacterium]
MVLDRSDVVFIYGALRSGTTVFRLMLNAHPAMSNPGEMDFLFDHLAPDPAHPTGWRYDLSALRAGRIFKASNLTIPPERDGLDLLEDFLTQLQDRAPGKALSINIHRRVDRMLSVMPHARVI